MEEQRDAFVVVVEYEGKPLDRRATVTVQRAISDAAHRVVQSRLLSEHGVPRVTIKVRPIENDEHE